ncbi:tetratricopeptide repeat protein, partial [Morganella morganii]
TLNFLRKLPNTSIGLSENIYFIYISPARINQFNEISIKLKPLTVTDTNTLIKHKLPQKHISNEDIQKLHDKSEGLVTKLETIIRYLSSSSVTEVIESTDIFKDIIKNDDISKTIIKQIDSIENDLNKKETHTLMKILSILNNGESVTNIKKTSVGKKVTIMDSVQLIESGLASSIDIDSTTTVIKLNPLVKDFIYSKLTIGEIEDISNQFIRIMLNKSKNAIQISSTNRKIMEAGYSTDGDNITSLIINEVIRIKKEDNDESQKTSLNAMKYYIRSYIYSLDNSSRFKELISSSLKLMNVINDGELQYEYHHYLASAYRMLGEYDLAKKHLDIAFELTPKNLKSKVGVLMSEYLLYFQKNDNNKAIELAKKIKKEFKANSLAYITAEEILALRESEDRKIKKLAQLEAKARKLKLNTAANNILFHLNEKNISDNKVTTMSEIIKTDNSEYNKCRAFIYKMDAMIKLGRINSITNKDIKSLSNIYNYLFYQRIDILFNKCLKVLWAIL